MASVSAMKQPSLLCSIEMNGIAAECVCVCGRVCHCSPFNHLIPYTSTRKSKTTTVSRGSVWGQAIESQIYGPLLQ